MITFGPMPEPKIFDQIRDKKALPWTEGYEAGFLVPTPDCPYKQDSLEWLRWWDGFCHAVNEDTP